VLFRSQHRWPEAEQQYRRAMELEPKNPTVYTTLARLYVIQKQTGKAEQVLKDAKSGRPVAQMILMSRLLKASSPLWS
jgi:Flp pilus assembly protein TadD